MARITCNTADFFQHTKAGRTKAILVSKFGNDGSSFLFNLLEILTFSEGHYYDCNVPGNMMYLAAYCNLTEDRARSIIDCMVEIGKLDKELWQNGVIWYQKFVDGFADLYKKRSRPLPQKPNCSRNEADRAFLEQESRSPVISGETITIVEHSRVEHSIAENSIGEHSTGANAPLCEPKKTNILDPEQQIFNQACSITKENITLTDQRRQTIREIRTHHALGADVFLRAVSNLAKHQTFPTNSLTYLLDKKFDAINRVDQWANSPPPEFAQKQSNVNEARVVNGKLTIPYIENTFK